MGFKLVLALTLCKCFLCNAYTHIYREENRWINTNISAILGAVGNVYKVAQPSTSVDEESTIPVFETEDEKQERLQEIELSDLSPQEAKFIETNTRREQTKNLLSEKTQVS